jgi:hypothetical protein
MSSIFNCFNQFKADNDNNESFINSEEIPSILGTIREPFVDYRENISKVLGNDQAERGW